MAVAITTWVPAGVPGVADAAVQCLESWLHGFVGIDSLHVQVADDGSPGDEHIARMRAVTEKTGATFGVVQTSRLGCGGAFAAAVQACLPHSNVIDYQQSDWLLTEPLDLAPSLALLDDYADAVRLGPTHPNLAAHIERTNTPGAEWCLEYEWAGGGYVVGWRPAIYHATMLQHEDLAGLEYLSAIEAERVWMERYANRRIPPRVFHAPNCTLAGPFMHIDTVELGEDDPATLTARYA